jgi:hypothetical protein
MAMKAPFSTSRKYSKYKVTNSSEYNEILRRRGRLDMMISPDIAEGWYEDYNLIARKTGNQRRYSDSAIRTCMEIRYLFRLPLRQTQGFVNYIFEICGFTRSCPDYSTLSRRSRSLSIKKKDYSDKEFDHISVDSTGVATYTGNEWLENKHGKSYKRKTWKKLHIGVDDTGEIVANEMSCHLSDDRSYLPLLIKNIRSKELLGDPGYDGEAIYQMLRKKGIKPTIRPPNKAITIDSAKDYTERQEQVIYIQEKGYHAWRVKNDYGRREKVENTFFRFKNSFGSKFLSRDDQNMKIELDIKCQLLNKMLKIGRVKTMRAA